MHDPFFLSPSRQSKTGQCLWRSHFFDQPFAELELYVHDEEARRRSIAVRCARAMAVVSFIS